MKRQQRPAARSEPGWEDLGVSMLNAVVGDYLGYSQNSLAITMAFYHANAPLALTAGRLRQVYPHGSAKLCVLIHGLGCNEHIWEFRDADRRPAGMSYGSLLHGDLGYTPFYLRYNTGLPITDNARELAVLLDVLLAAYALPVEEIVLIGHSMGGLVIRGACDYAQHLRHSWVRLVRRVVYLGTPHTGAPLARLGHLVTAVLDLIPNPITAVIRDVLNVRSAGVKDLRHGHTGGAHAGHPAGHWLPGAEHYLVAGTLHADLAHPVNVVLGDWLVRVESAGAHDHHKGELPHIHVQIFPGVSHNGLAHDPAVYQQIKQWCAKGDR